MALAVALGIARGYTPKGTWDVVSFFVEVSLLARQIRHLFKTLNTSWFSPPPSTIVDVTKELMLWIS